MQPSPVRISSYGVVSAAGVGAKPLHAALRSGAAPATDTDAIASVLDGQPAPAGASLRPVPDFVPRDYLGRKGLSAMSRTTRLGMVAAELALDRLPLADEGRPIDTGVVLGTSTGSARAFAEFFRESYEAERPYLVSPALFPGLLLNHGASQVAMRHSFTGVNASLAGGQISSFSALRYARSALLTGRAERILAGGVEELSAQTAWAWHRSVSAGAPSVISEGGAVFVLEPGAGDAGGALAELTACEVAFTPLSEGPTAVAAALTKCISAALRSSGIGQGDVAFVSAGSSTGSGWAAVEERGRRGALGKTRRVELHPQDVLGETYSASGGLQLAALLAHWEHEGPLSAHDSPWGLVTSVGHDGSTAAAVVRAVSTS